MEQRTRETEGGGQDSAARDRSVDDGRGQGGAGTGGEEGRRRPVRESPLQLAVTWLSGMLILTIVVYLVWEGTRPFVPASFSAEVEQVHAIGGDHHVRLRVINEGGQSVQGLRVVLELREDEEVVESISALLEWLPERSSRELVLISERDPADYTPVVRFEGYQIP